ncbi:MAG: hypothetical protein J6V87_01700 [Prevotella sp.]|nr:hypothetical protein [Prevotella sp.]
MRKKRLYISPRMTVAHLTTDRLLFLNASPNQMIDDPNWEWDSDGAQ